MNALGSPPCEPIHDLNEVNGLSKNPAFCLVSRQEIVESAVPRDNEELHLVRELRLRIFPVDGECPVLITFLRALSVRGELRGMIVNMQGPSRTAHRGDEFAADAR